MKRWGREGGGKKGGSRRNYIDGKWHFMRQIASTSLNI